MAMIKFTNTGQFADMPIYINRDHITSVFEVATNEGSLATHIFCGLGKESVVWIVQESLGQVIKAIGRAEKKE